MNIKNVKIKKEKDLARLLMALLVISILAASILVTGCGQDKKSNNSGTTADTGKKFMIVTSFYPMYLATINIVKDIPGVEVVNMTKPQTGCLHDYQLTPEDVVTLGKANAFIVNGAGMETFLEKVIKQQPNLKVIEASTNIPLLKDENGEENPHVWVSISNSILQVKNIAEQLAVADPGHAEKYKENADNYIQKLTNLRDKMHAALDGIKQHDIITFHEAFPYFAKEFNLNIVAVVEREPGSEPSPQELKETIEKIKSAKINALFAEPQYPAKAAQTIASETGIKIYTLDPVVTGEAKPEAADDYLKKMEENLKTLQGALK